MILGLCLITFNLLCWAVVAMATRPTDHLTRQRELSRRFRQLRQNPDRVAFLDVENLLLSGSTPPTVVARVMGRAASRRLTARTMWRWAAVHGSESLVAVVDAGVAEDTLLDHLDAGTAPDRRTLDVFARLADDTVPVGMPIDELVDLGAVSSLDDVPLVVDLAAWSTPPPVEPHELRRFDNLPPIAGPGWPPVRPRSEWDLGDEGWRGIA